ncbi:MAG: SpoIIE family protein phosphatase [Ramlibacter sp.]|nr:SpoIIE family protein phosphatase [Ramlibacter sp.]
METTIDVCEKSQVAEVRRVVAERAVGLGMSEADQGRAALVATEISTNLVKYGRQGAVTVSTFAEWRIKGLQMVAVDHGPGFSNFVASARDGHSTGGSLGIGLGAVMRHCDLFDVYTVEAQGSALLCRIVTGSAVPTVPEGALVLGARSTPMRGQIECGDAWSHTGAGGRQWLCVVDGLGHGPLAALASAEAVAIFRGAAQGDSPADILARAHAALKSTRGAVMAVAAIDGAAGVLQFAGVGNIAAVLYQGDETHHLLSVEGIVGYNARNFRMQERAWSDNAVLVLSSDGLSTRWNLSRYPGLLQRHPGLIASVLFRDFARDTDDATIVVAKGKR